MRRKYDVIIVGGGVVGCMIARFLSRYQIDILLIEKEADIGMGASCANSSIVHPGYDPVPGSLKALINVRANAMWDDVSAELGIPFARCGDYVVAIGLDEMHKLDRLHDQGVKNGVPGMSIIGADEMRRAEPNINPAVTGALWASTGGVCDPFMAVVAAAENAIQNGVEILLETAFEDFIFDKKRITGVKTNHGDFEAAWVINAAGLYADEVMHKAGVRPEFKITPRRGEYAILDKADITINHILFPVPSETSKGILVTTTLHGNTIVGPNAENIPDKEDHSATAHGFDEIWQGGKKLVPSIEIRQIIATFVGLRAGGNAPCKTPGVDYDKDFIIEIPTEVEGFVNVAGIESPGLTAAPAIAEMVVDLLKDAGLEMKEKAGWNPIRPARPRFCHMTPAEQAALVKSDPGYGRVVCRCENVTEGEILAEIHSPIPARTYDAIKRRTWLGTGRCLGGFDMPRVVDILAKELNVAPIDITKKGKGSEFLFRKTKEVEA